MSKEIENQKVAFVESCGWARLNNGLWRKGEGGAGPVNTLEGAFVVEMEADFIARSVRPDPPPSPGYPFVEAQAEPESDIKRVAAEWIRHCVSITRQRQLAREGAALLNKYRHAVGDKALLIQVDGLPYAVTFSKHAGVEKIDYYEVSTPEQAQAAFDKASQ